MGYPWKASLMTCLLLLVSLPWLAKIAGAIQAAPTAGSFPSISLHKIASGFDEPTDVASPGDGSGRLFVLEKKGLVRIISGGKILPTPFLDIKRLVKSSGSEQGLLGIAFSPRFKKDGEFYVNYTNHRGIGNSTVACYRVGSDPNRADPASARMILNVTQPYANHNGGQLAFGPDGYLYIGFGDGGSAGDPHKNGQNLGTFLGKMLRLDVASGAIPYRIPPGNPFKNEIWAYGLRNPWRFSFDRATRDLYIADVGQDLYEEVDVQPAGSKGGENYGWNIMEGFHCFERKNCSKKGLTMPVAEYDHSQGDCSITGGFVYRGKNFPSLQGIYLFGDYCSGRIWGLRRSGGRWEKKLLLKTSLNISTFGEDEAGTVYVADFAKGDIYWIEGK
ncbi:PQQ-dependent sugar dehydrogenase [Geotalea sp. SG265]|uniref:PQQ-dependent sugar dehydrogenase n=1 Tax=Geotalea sp. SG265 TaxID=2922867 RepID=UPI001FAEE019|nr:PQQ-dependent sugar dehydrogenase [Geotalea sp. SG265]